MVSVFTEIIKINRLNISVSSLLDRTLTNFEYGSNNYCRHCGKKYMKPFEKYTRVLTDYHNGEIVMKLCHKYLFLKNANFFIF